MPGPDIVSLSSHPFAYWSGSLLSLADEMKDKGRKQFRQDNQDPVLVLVERPSTLESDWDESETELSSRSSDYEVHHRGYGEHLVALRKSNRNQQEAKVTVGRAPNNDVIIRSAKISKLHAAFEVAKSRHYLVDMGSSNGTWVNQKRLEPGRSARLKGGETVTLWRYQFHFLLPDGLVRLLEKY